MCKRCVLQNVESLIGEQRVKKRGIHDLSTRKRIGNEIRVWSARVDIKPLHLDCNKYRYAREEWLSTNASKQLAETRRLPMKSDHSRFEDRRRSESSRESE
ncbi:hypothetical protein AVEN_128971-1 [Araneus ventricosus]|uniref:Uncharacterized protein n=1 Tax=Araneus ventricosus TaxID=182803 RepID=A0A4Y2QDD7_ARAVE|nr:hypothetical protein AVEN_128971-1 [Araneus ventricosus]